MHTFTLSHFLLFFIVLLFTTVASAQSKKELQTKRDKLQREIDDANKQLNLLSKSKTVTLSQLTALKKKISLRQQLIGTINKEISSLGNEIQKTGVEIFSLEAQMEKLKADYANLIRFAQKNQNRYQRLMFVFAAQDFNQAYKRVKYLQQINEFRRQQAALIDSTQNKLSQKKSELESQKNEKLQLRDSEVKEKKNLDKEKQEQDQMMTKLQQNEKKLRQIVADKKKAKDKLEKSIETLIRKEIEAAKKKAVASGKKNVTSKNVFSLTPEAQKLSSSFAGNKGSLPWPVEAGSISSSFGEHAHPTLKGVKVKNDGVDIESIKGSFARSVFQGEVSGTIDIPGSGAAVIIRHGEYISVYSNLKEIFVKKGDNITTKQKIGIIAENDEGTKSEINLQIWKGFSKLNPEPWLAGR
ncbi:MAG TPA: peptidoglycan DD-metalloendopeptidase family protein [Bacteroidia bacterium]|nr:peptidoglycan DD-metalloendopeptidase family protein [Bacteroidia bacterium]